MVTLINGSQKIANSNSTYFLKLISDERIYNLNYDNYKEVINSIKKNNIIIFATPLYVDSISSNLISFLDYIYDNKIDIKDKSVYIIINCGFKEAEHNIVAANIIKNFSNKMKANYKGFILIGAGEIIGNKKFKFISKKALNKIEELKYEIIEEKNIKDNLLTIDYVESKLYLLLGNILWKKKAKKNKIKL